MNRLVYEKSPYLKQHQHNPIHWFAWGPEAFAKAKTENKAVFLSIGYATCHWCHVMERECFEVQEVADVLNDHFVSIKVDREEHPDVDQIYMDALVGMAGHGGWPMSMFLTPDGNPFFGGTYFPKKNFLSLLDSVQAAWTQRREEIFATGREYSAYLAQKPVASAKIDLPKIFENFEKVYKFSFDPVYGGRKGAPKFPNLYDQRVILRRSDKDSSLLDFVQKTLQSVLAGGIYDHVGGGIARYSTDEKWLVPHFEKMLYDQASLLWVLAEAYQATGSEVYRHFIQKTQSYLFRDLTHPEGGFFSAEDADSEGVEGKFYVWPPNDLKKLLPTDEFEALSKVFDLNDSTIFEGGWIFSLSPFKLAEVASPQMETILKKLHESRSQRPRPLRDEKILSSWNGLIISALFRCAFALRSPVSLIKAERALDFVLKNLCTADGKILRRWVEGEAKYDGTLEDYAFVIQALLDAYEFTGKDTYLQHARRFQQKQDEVFWSSTDKAYYLTGEDPLLIRRTLEFHDSVMPSGTSVAFTNLQRLYWITDDRAYQSRMEELLSSIPQEIESHPHVFSHWLLALDTYASSPKVLTISGLPASDLFKLPPAFAPQLIIKRQKSEKKEAMICWKQSCSLPLQDLSTLHLK